MKRKPNSLLFKPLPSPIREYFRCVPSRAYPGLSFERAGAGAGTGAPGSVLLTANTKYVPIHLLTYLVSCIHTYKYK